MSTKAKITAVCAAAALILLMRLLFFGNGAAAVFKPVTAEAGQELAYAYDSGASFYSFNSNNFYFCTKDGVKFLSSKGGQLWDEVMNLTSPVIYGKCDILAVGEPRGRKVYVFNTQGKLQECTFDSPVLNFSVNRNGCLTVILQTSSGYRIETHMPGSVQPTWQYVMVKPNLYPISADTSPDGRVTAISVLDLTPDAQNSMTTQIMFLYTNESDAMKLNSADGIFAGETLSGQIAKVCFMDNRLLAVSDTAVTAYLINGKDQVGQDWELPLTNKISRFCTYGESGFAFITGEAFADSQNASDPGILNFYNMNGRRTGKFSVGSEADYISMDWGGAVVGSGRSFSAVSSRGALLWQYKSPIDLAQLIFLDNENTALSAGSTSAVIMQRS